MLGVLRSAVEEEEQGGPPPPPPPRAHVHAPGGGGGSSSTARISSWPHALASLCKLEGDALLSEPCSTVALPPAKTPDYTGTDLLGTAAKAMAASLMKDALKGAKQVHVTATHSQEAAWLERQLQPLLDLVKEERAGPVPTDLSFSIKVVVGAHAKEWERCVEGRSQVRPCMGGGGHKSDPAWGGVPCYSLHTTRGGWGVLPTIIQCRLLT